MQIKDGDVIEGASAAAIIWAAWDGMDSCTCSQATGTVPETPIDPGESVKGLCIDHMLAGLKQNPSLNKFQAWRIKRKILRWAKGR